MKFREMQPWIQRRYINENINKLFDLVRVENDWYRSAENRANDFLGRRELKMPKYEVSADLEIKLLPDTIGVNLKKTLRKILKMKSDEKAIKDLSEAILSIEWLEQFEKEREFNPYIYHHNKFGISFKELKGDWIFSGTVADLQKRKDMILESIQNPEKKRLVQEQFITLLFDESIEVRNIYSICEDLVENHIRKINKTAVYIDSILNVAYEVIANGIVSCDTFGTITKILNENEKIEYEQMGINVRKVEKIKVEKTGN